MLENFGARLRQRRVEQGIPLNAIAQQTKIKLSLLEGLERDDVSRWPAGIFRRAYIRAYAQAIGLDPDVVVREFVEAHPEPSEVTTDALEIALASDRARANASPQSRLRDIVGSALGSLARFRRTPAVEQSMSSHDPRGTSHEELEEASVAAYSAHQLGLADTADDAGVEVAAEPPVTSRKYEPVVVPPPAAAIPALTREDAVVEPPPPAPVLEQAESKAAKGDNRHVAPPDLLGLARLCTDFGRVDAVEDVPRLLQQAAGMLDATGLIVWLWDDSVDGLRPALACGYSDRVLAHLPTVTRDDDNATADAFRSGEPCVIGGSGHASGALAIPLATPAGCGGVLAIELQQGVGTSQALIAVATIIAACIAQLIPRPYASKADMEFGSALVNG